MKSYNVKVRIRPGKVVLLIDKYGDLQLFQHAVNFLSTIWGGMYFPILSVDARKIDLDVLSLLSEMKPEYIYGFNIDESIWRKAIMQGSQPRVFRVIFSGDSFVANSIMGYNLFAVNQVLVPFFKNRSVSFSQREQLSIVNTEGSNLIKAAASAMFGKHHEGLYEHFRDESIEIKANDSSDLVNLATSFLRASKLSWINMTTLGLKLYIARCSIQGPTIVIIKDPLQDLCLYWNRRSCSDLFSNGWVIPVLFEDIEKDIVTESLKQFFLASLNRYSIPNFICITSCSASKTDCIPLIEKLKLALEGSSFKHIQFQDGINVCPIVLPYDHEKVLTIQRSNRSILIPSSSLSCIEQIGSGQHWFMDLLSDVQTKRSFMEVGYSSFQGLSQLLNAPNPPSVHSSIIDRVGYGMDGVNIKTDTADSIIDFYMPDNIEFFSEVLIDAGFEPSDCEKRNVYLPAIKLLGGLMRAANSLSGIMLVIVKTLMSRNSPTKNKSSILTYTQINGAVRKQPNSLESSTHPDIIDYVHQTQGVLAKRIAQKRFDLYWNQKSLNKNNIINILEYFVTIGAAERHFKSCVCERCHLDSYVTSVPQRGTGKCHNCGGRITFGSRIDCGYSLIQPFNHALCQGLIPVVLTGRFLKNLTRNSFVWLPGMKYSSNKKKGDIDIIACCDGNLVFCECKDLETSEMNENLENSLLNQFSDLTDVAISCRASFVVLSSMVETYSDRFQEQIEAIISGRIKYILLSKSDLENGFREIPFQGIMRHMKVADIISPISPDIVLPDDSEARIIHLNGAIEADQT